MNLNSRHVKVITLVNAIPRVNVSICRPSTIIVTPLQNIHDLLIRSWQIETQLCLYCGRDGIAYLPTCCCRGNINVNVNIHHTRGNLDAGSGDFTWNNIQLSMGAIKQLTLEVDGITQGAKDIITDLSLGLGAGEAIDIVDLDNEDGLIAKDIETTAMMTSFFFEITAKQGMCSSNTSLGIKVGSENNILIWIVIGTETHARLTGNNGTIGNHGLDGGHLAGSAGNNLREIVVVDTLDDEIVGDVGTGNLEEVDGLDGALLLGIALEVAIVNVAAKTTGGCTGERCGEEPGGDHGEFHLDGRVE